MNYKLFKTSAFAILTLAIVIMTGCVKKAPAGYVDFSSLDDYVALVGASSKASNIQVNTSSTDTIFKSIVVDLASATNNNGAINVTIGADNPKIATYNSANGTSYQPFPTGSFKVTSVTIPAGQHYATANLQIYQNKLDPSISYMLPISILDGGGKKLSSNLNTIYYNVIGNPLAGSYLWDFIRYNGDTTTARNGSSFFGQTGSFVPASPTSVVMPDSYLQTFVDPAAGVLLTFTNTNGVLSNFKVSFDATTASGLAAGGFTVAKAPVLLGAIIVGNAATHYAGSTFRVYFSLVNSSGGTRTLIDNFVKQ